ncbi:MAG: hypothetical protein WDW38_004169 [Sanguina aurantia]
MALQVITELVNMFRTMWLLIIFAPVIITSPIALIWDVKRSEWMEMLRKTLESAGPAFIKWGQWAATRHDIFPPDFCSELEHLHCSAPAHTFWHTRKAIQGAFGVPIFELFESIDTQPVASGSIGQIHKAVLSAKGAAITGFKPGTTVAVKVRHPGVGNAVVRDFGTMMYVARLASKLPALRNLRLEDTLKQFAAPLTEQVDMSREAANLARFNHNFRKSRCVTFPVPLYPLVSADVLVESFEEGQHITNYINSTNNPYNNSLPGHICAVVVTTMVLEGWSNKLDPTHSVLAQVQEMFAGENVSWGQRITGLVQQAMLEEETHAALR